MRALLSLTVMGGQQDYAVAASKRPPCAFTLSVLNPLDAVRLVDRGPLDFGVAGRQRAEDQIGGRWSLAADSLAGVAGHRDHHKAALGAKFVCSLVGGILGSSRSEVVVGAHPVGVRTCGNDMGGATGQENGAEERDDFVFHSDWGVVVF